MDIRCFLPAHQVAAFAAVSTVLERLKKLELKPILTTLPFTINPAVFTHTF